MGPAITLAVPVSCPWPSTSASCASPSGGGAPRSLSSSSAPDRRRNTNKCAPPGIRTEPLTPEYPKDERDHQRNHDAGRDGKVERVALALELHVAGEVAQPELRQ